jgi:hypothetical protein
MTLIVAVKRGDAREQILKFLARHEVTVGQCRSPEVRQQRVAGTIDPNLVATRHLDGI